MGTRVSKLEAAVEHVQADLADIKATLRIHDAKFDSLRDHLDGMRDRIDGTRDRIDGVRDRMERDFRVLFGALIAVTLGLAGLMAKGFQWL